MAFLPNHDRAYISIEKLRDYCLNEYHPVGKNKANVFARALGIKSTGSAFLRKAILNALSNRNALPAGKDQYGERFTVDIPISNGNKNALVRTGWIIKSNEAFPRLTSCYVKKKL